jgi:hypothetical protein
MKIIHLVKEYTESGAADTVIEDHTGLGHDVTVVKLKEEKNYDRVVDEIFANDKVFTW